MSEQHDREYFGPYQLVRPLAPGVLAERWLALNEKRQSSHVVHRFATCRDRAERRRLLSAVEAVAVLSHPHILPIEEFSFRSEGGGWVVTPYTGNSEGLVSLEHVLSAKGGQMSPFEAERAVCHLLEAMEYAHLRSIHHGPLELGEILVDRHGRVIVELLGLRRQLAGPGPAHHEAARDDVRAVAALAYRLLTGLVADEPRIQAGRLVRRLSRAWDEWLEYGLDASGGFTSAREALVMLPSSRRGAEPREPSVRMVLGRLRSSIRAR